MRGKSSEGARVDESTNVGVDQDGAWSLKIHLHSSSIPFHGTCKIQSYIEYKQECFFMKPKNVCTAETYLCNILRAESGLHSHIFMSI